MSRIGKKPISIPAGVTLTLDGQTVTVKGPKGQLSWTVAEEVEVKQEATASARVGCGAYRAPWWPTWSSV
jgi:large subunit ribosomal protein L6